MKTLQLSIGIADYFHTRPLFDGTVQIEGIELVRVAERTEEIFWRFSNYLEFDVSEFSFAGYSAIRSRDQEHSHPRMVAIPVFPSRVFRHSSFYVRKGAGITRPQDLAGRRIGIPEWAQTAGVFARGFLAHQAGVRLEEIKWVQAGVDQAGRRERVQVSPPGMTIERIADRSLSAMLAAGEIDAIISARAPAAFERGEAGIVRLFPDYAEVEEEYARATGIFPIMHVIAIRGEVYRDHPWVAMNLYKAFDTARKIALERLFELGFSPLPMAWLAVAAERSRRLFQGDNWPYGVESNRVTIEAFQQYLAEQGITPRPLKPEELFARETQTAFRT